MSSNDSKNNNLGVNYKDVLPSKYRAGIAWTWVLAIFSTIVLTIFLADTLINPEYMAQGNYNVLSTTTIIKLILFPLAILIVFLIASLVCAKINSLKEIFIKKYVAKMLAERKAKEERDKKLAEQNRKIVLPKQEELEDDNDSVNRQMFLEQSELPDVVKQFLEYAKLNGRELSEETIVDIFSAMSCSRVVFVQAQQSKTYESICQLLNAFFDGRIYKENLTQYSSDGKTRKARFFEWVNGCANNNRLNVACITAQDYQTFATEYGEFLPVLINPEGYNDYATLSNFSIGEDYVFPTSIWCLVHLEDVCVSTEFSKNCVVLNLGNLSFESKSTQSASANIPSAFKSQFFAKPAEEPAENSTLKENPNKIISYTRISDIISEETSAKSLSLEIWKKLDLVEQYISLSKNNYFNNKTCRQVERYVAILLAGGLDEAKALDRVLANKILPYLVAIPRECFAENTESVSEFIDRVFGLSNLPLCEVFLTISSVKDVKGNAQASKQETVQTSAQPVQTVSEVEQPIKEEQPIKVETPKPAETVAQPLKAEQPKPAETVAQPLKAEQPKPLDGFNSFSSAGQFESLDDIDWTTGQKIEK